MRVYSFIFHTQDHPENVQEHQEKRPINHSLKRLQRRRKSRHPHHIMKSLKEKKSMRLKQFMLING